MKTKILLAALTIVLLQSCTKENVTANRNIPDKIRTVIKSKNDSLLVALRTSNPKLYKALGTKNFIKHLQGEIRNVVWLYRKGYLNNIYTTYDEYTVKLSKPYKYVELESDEKQYTFTYLAEAEDTYVSLLKTSLYQNDYLLAVIYNLTEDGWKINDIEVSMFGHLNKTAKEYYDMAKAEEEKGKNIDAFFYADIAAKSINESESMLKFEDADDILSYSNQIRYRLLKNNKFPNPLTNITTKPEVLKIEWMLTKEAIVPLITYKTHLPLNDSLRVEDEFEFVKQEVKRTYSELDFNKPKIFYNAQGIVKTKDKAGQYSNRIFEHTHK